MQVGEAVREAEGIVAKARRDNRSQADRPKPPSLEQALMRYHHAVYNSIMRNERAEPGLEHPALIRAFKELSPQDQQLLETHHQTMLHLFRQAFIPKPSGMEKGQAGSRELERALAHYHFEIANSIPQIRNPVLTHNMNHPALMYAFSNLRSEEQKLVQEHHDDMLSLFLKTLITRPSKQ